MNLLAATNLKKLEDNELLNLSKEKTQAERKLTLEVIAILQEIRDRRLHLQRGYSSLFEYCVKELKYSDGAAARRLKAMKLVEEVPETLKAIESGALSLSIASQLQVAFDAKVKEKKPLLLEAKKAIISQVENQSRRQAERVIAQISPEVISRHEKITQLNATQVKLELVIDQELKRKDPETKAAKLKSKKVEFTPPAPLLGVTARSARNPSKKNFRYILSTVRQEVWMRDKGRCTYFDSKTKRICDSNHKIQFEHIVPYSYGGVTTVQNLRLLCASHNQLTAQQIGGWKQ